MVGLQMVSNRWLSESKIILGWFKYCCWKLMKLGYFFYYFYFDISTEWWFKYDFSNLFFSYFNWNMIFRIYIFWYFYWKMIGMCFYDFSMGEERRQRSIRAAVWLKISFLLFEEKLLEMPNLQILIKTFENLPGY